MKRGTQTEIAKGVNRSVQFIHNIIAGRQNCPVKLAASFESVTGISAAEWVFAPRDKLVQLLEARYGK